MSDLIPIVSFASILAMLILVSYYFWQIKSWPLRIVLLLLAIQPIGAIFKIMHLPGGDELLIAETLASILFGILIGYVNFKSKKNIYFYVIAMILVLHPILYFSDITVPKSYSQILTYFLVGVIGTVKLKSQVIDAGIDKVLNIYLLTGIITIMIDTFRLLNI